MQTQVDSVREEIAVTSISCRHHDSGALSYLQAMVQFLVFVFHSAGFT